MMEEWKEYKLGEVVISVKDRITTSVLNASSYISTENMLPNKAGVTLSSGVPSGNAIKFVADDILISNIRPYFKKIWQADRIGGCSSDVICLRATNITEPIYLYYLLSQDRFFDYVMQGTKGTKMPRGDRSQIMQWPVLLPSKDKQKKIASILKYLDDKIEVNRKINENLEQQAQALFKSWFVDFEHFKNGEFVESELGMIPKGWRVGTLGEYCKVRSGFAFKSTWWTNEGVPVIKIKNITDNGNLEMLDCSFVSKEHAALAKEFQTIEGDLLIAMTGATIGKFCIVHDNSKYCVNQRVGKFFLGNEPLKKLPFIFLNLKQSSVHDEIINRGQGSAQPNISGGDIETLKVVIAPDVVISNFNVMLYPSFKKMISNQQESRRLSELRDTLLPKLMSGELKVNEIEI